MQIGVAHAASLDGHNSLTWARIRNDDCLDGDGFALGSGDDAAYFLWHCSSPAEFIGPGHGTALTQTSALPLERLLPSDRYAVVADQ